MKSRQSLPLAAGCLACLLVAQVAQAGNPIPVVSRDAAGDAIDTTDYSNVPADYWWFANWNTTAPETGQPVQQNELNNLPSWFQLDPNFSTDPLNSTYTWSDNLVLGSLVNHASSTGGVTTFNMLTLPDSSTGLSGSAVDTKEAGNTGQSNNILQRVVFGADVPSSFRLWVVVDNESADQGTGVRRVKARLSGPGVPNDTEADTGNGIDDLRNNIADAYAFVYNNVSADQVLAIQLRNSNNADAARGGTSMAGFMIEVIPEPSSLALLGISALGLGLVRKRR
jgi:hypothetical protein